MYCWARDTARHPDGVAFRFQAVRKSKFNLCFKSGVYVGCWSLQSGERIPRRSCPRVGLSDDRGADIARRDNLTHWLIASAQVPGPAAGHLRAAWRRSLPVSKQNGFKRCIQSAQAREQDYWQLASVVPRRLRKAHEELPGARWRARCRERRPRSGLPRLPDGRRQDRLRHAGVALGPRPIFATGQECISGTWIVERCCYSGRTRWKRPSGC